MINEELLSTETRYAKGTRPVVALGFSPASLYTYRKMPGCIRPVNHETVFVSCVNNEHG